MGQVGRPLTILFIKKLRKADIHNREAMAWQAFLNLCADPIDSKKKKQKFVDVDEKIGQFVADDSSTLVMENLESVVRLWIHQRARQAGLKSNSSCGRERGYVKTLTLTKPDGWTLPDVPLDILKSSPKPKKVNVNAEIRHAKMEAWRTTCELCYNTLDAYTALYNWRGIGPYCEDCIEEDANLAGLKWEAKADFW